MGMDVFGNNPSSETGRYFRNNVWWWSPLATYIEETHPGIAARCGYWHSNDGDGLDAASATELADALDLDIAEGRVAAYAATRDEALAALPSTVCHLCTGTGIRTDEIGARYGYDTPRDPVTGKGGCNGCGGSGQLEAFERSYQFDAENVAEFAAFLRDSGGFVIW